MVTLSRRKFTAGMSLLAGTFAHQGLAAMASAPANARHADADEARKLAVQSWTFHQQLFRGEIAATQLPAIVKELGIDTIEWTAKTFRPLTGGRETMFQAPSNSFFRDLRNASDDAGVKTRVLNVGGYYYLAAADANTRAEAIDFAMSYAEGADILGASILRSELYCDLPDSPTLHERALDAAMAGWGALIERTAGSDLVINVENHHGISSQPVWLARLVSAMNNERAGLTVDTNNFRTDIVMPYTNEATDLPRYVDRYEGLEMLMPLANWLSAKTYTFDNTGYEISLNYPRIMRIIHDSGYEGPVSIEYEGNEDPVEGVRKSVAMFDHLAAHGLG